MCSSVWSFPYARVCVSSSKKRGAVGTFRSRVSHLFSRFVATYTRRRSTHTTFYIKASVSLSLFSHTHRLACRTPSLGLLQRGHERIRFLKRTQEPQLAHVTILFTRSLVCCCCFSSLVPRPLYSGRRERPSSERPSQRVGIWAWVRGYCFSHSFRVFESSSK